MIVRVQLHGDTRNVQPEELEALVREGVVGPETLVERDGQWIAARNWPGFAALRDDPEAQVRARWSAPIVPWATALVVGTAVRVHLGAPGSGGWLHDTLARSTPAILERGEGWRVLGYGLLHANLPHLLSNMAAIVVAGIAFERLMGHGALVGVLVLSVATGGLASTFSLPGTPSVGMSAGDYGLLGACAVLGVRHGTAIPRAAQAAFGATAAIFTVWSFAGGLSAQGVDNTAHFVGLLTGVVLGAFYRPAIPAWRRQNRVVHGFVAALTALCVVLPAAWGPALVRFRTYEADGVVAERPAYWQVTVSRSGLRGYGPYDRSAAVSLDTRRLDEAHDAAVVFETERARVARVDPSATLTVLDAERAVVEYTAGNEPRSLRLRVVQRGAYATVGGVDTTRGARIAPLLAERVLERWTLRPPDEAHRR